ncbi:Lhr-like helicases [Klebsiella pneumoniae IS39]|nr:Lhr-like helicases [Klebsiella pneumoniae IS39]
MSAACSGNRSAIRRNFKRYYTPLITLIEEVLKGGRKQNELIRYLQDALQLLENAIQSILWSPPRSIMLEFLPTILRNLKSHWAVNGVEWAALRAPQADDDGEQYKNDLSRAGIYSAKSV